MKDTISLGSGSGKRGGGCKFQRNEVAGCPSGGRLGPQLTVLLPPWPAQFSAVGKWLVMLSSRGSGPLLCTRWVLVCVLSWLSRKERHCLGFSLDPVADCGEQNGHSPQGGNVFGAQKNAQT